MPLSLFSVLAGCFASDISSTSTTGTLAETTSAAPTPTSGFVSVVPSGFSAEQLGLRDYVLSWDAVPGAVGYQLRAFGRVWRETDDTSIAVELETGSDVCLVLVAVNDSGERSATSRSVCIVGEEREP